MNKIICIVGPTASGKSELAVKIAKKLNGEIISADSRQVYKGMDIGTGKVEGRWENIGGKNVFVYKTIPHYLIDEVSPRSQYSVARFQKQASRIIKDIIKRGKLPIICGGTGHWVDAVVFEQTIPEVKPNSELRRKLEELSTTELYKNLKKLDPVRAASIDAKNPRRLIRALEIINATGKAVPAIAQQSNYEVKWIGINPGLEILTAKIEKRFNGWIRQGMIEEVSNLHKNGLSWVKLESFGLEYKYTALYLQGKINKLKMKEQSLLSLRQYAKRQLTWWKRNKNISWFKDDKTALLNVS